MDIKSNLPKLAIAGVLIAGAVFMIEKFNGQSGAGSTVVVNVPVLSVEATQGEKLFLKNCKACHGKNAGGSRRGPPLIHKIYESGHHGDHAFVLAAKIGVRAHHWKFGDMPPQPQVSEGDVAKIIVYLREVQRANGIN